MGEHKTEFQQMIERETRANPAPAQAMLPLKVAGDLRDDATRDEEARKYPGGPGKAGRPPGSKNKTTAAWVAYMRARYTAPMIALAEMYSRNVRDLALDLGLDWGELGFDERMELLEFQKKCAAELLPYLHQKQPVAVEVDARGVVQLVVHEAAPVPIAGGDDDGEGALIDVTPANSKTEENQ